ncbi:SDR family oxidoreductase [Pseudoduganella ginsengisoli]|uniref:SDR family oxidoreductase n=1 Tax=Pseudoduganella ginsengisoli TaxID=1462440 RepID=A0A6L6Q5Y9_9BURK|nr:SDR family oxidoreductase [Pseudoduganella ginsengisoli]MTW05090.1 SDR family oxidoreductase [Pseudoduganella ginsengisoli]
MRVIIITGASDGIGAEMARQLAQRAAGKIDQDGHLALVLAARNRPMLDAVAAECATYGARTLTVPTDVSDQNQCKQLVQAAADVFGRIDVLVNNAGRSGHALFEDVQDLGWYEEMMRINLWGSVWCTHAALPYLKQTRGSVVAVASLAGLVGVPGRTAYSASKFAMSGFFEALRAEVKSAGVSVTTAYPGVVDTRIRYRGYNAAGGELGSSSLKEDGAMPVAECARLIIEGMEHRKREVVMSAKGKLGRWMKLIAPGLVENMALKAVSEEHRPHS